MQKITINRLPQGEILPLRRLKPGFILSLILTILLTSSSLSYAQKDVMLQAFYWDVPVDDENNKGLWWNNLSNKAPEFKNFGISGIWVPSPAKGNWGIFDMGYGIYDHYDLGNYLQKGSVETRFGSRAELEQMLTEMHNSSDSMPKIEVYADIILNHIYSNDEDAEANPAVKKYVFDEAYRHGYQHQPYPSNEIKWIIPNAPAGAYYILVKGYNLDYLEPYQSRAYDIMIDYDNTGFCNEYLWESEPNNGDSQTNDFPHSGNTMRGFINYKGDIDGFKIIAPGEKDIIIKLTACEQSELEWKQADQTHGYYPFEIWHKGMDIAPSALEAHTNTGISYPAHTGPGEQNWTWNHSHFHPSDENDWLGDWGKGDEIISNTKGYGNDLNTFSSVVQERMNTWGKWLVEFVGFDGFRLDFVRGFQEEYAASWISNLPLSEGKQRFVVGEYWGSAPAIHAWVKSNKAYGAEVSAFDFPLKASLRDMCNGDESFNMTELNHAGMVRNNNGYGLPPSSVVTFLENHDTGKEHDKWVTKDWLLGYAYILTHEGRPCVFYPHLYGVTLHDYNDKSKKVNIPAELQEEIVKLIQIRSAYLDGPLSVLSKSGNPYPAYETANMYVARRQGNDAKSGAIIVINNSYSTKGLWVDSTPASWPNWAGKTLVNAFNNKDATVVYNDGRVWLEAPPRGYTIYIPESDHVNELNK
ncbi:MAG TPA: alpha-amylase [Marinilabiliaceae bacterium]|nr:alpha-amylase [Marinilabiliaceae bacterium]